MKLCIREGELLEKKDMAGVSSDDKDQ